MRSEKSTLIVHLSSLDNNLFSGILLTTILGTPRPSTTSYTGET